MSSRPDTVSLPSTANVTGFASALAIVGLTVVLGFGLDRGDGVGAGEPLTQVEIGTALGAEGVIGAHCRLAADRAFPWAIERHHLGALACRFCLRRGHRRYPSPGSAS